MTEPQLDFRTELEKMRAFAGKLPNEYCYRGLYDFVLREGRFFEPRPLPSDIKFRSVKQCFRNARFAAIKKKLPYVEGFALSSTSGTHHFHAWNLDADGFVVDTTWEPAGTVYLGVVFPLSLVRRSRGSIIDDWEGGFPLLRKALK